MSDHIAHIGICDDTFRLAAALDGIDPEFKGLMHTHRDDAHMGSVTRSADKWSARVIAAVAQAGHSGRPDPLGPRKLAFVLGALTHRAADRLTKPITNCWKGDPDRSADEPGTSGADQANESKIMQDLLVYREVFHGGEGTPATPFDPTVLGSWGDDSQRDFERLYRILLRRALIAMHTLNPDDRHIDQWFEGFFRGLQTYPKSLEQYARLAAQWDPQKVQRYLVEKRFYQRGDALIRLARAIQHGGSATHPQVAEAHAATDHTHSRYARALAKALDYLLAAGDLYRGRIPLAEAEARFDIGVPELSIQD